MLAHSLSNRPIVIDSNQIIEIKLSPNNASSPRLSCDGQQYFTLPAGSQVEIRKKEKCLHLIHPLNYNYYDTLRSKLHWGKNLIKFYKATRLCF
jgi:NAD+ kinase